MYNIQVYDKSPFAPIFRRKVHRTEDYGMPRFFVSHEDVEKLPDGYVITILGDDANHISRVLRMKPGEHVTACDTDGREYETVIRQTGNTVILDVLSSKMSQNEPPYKAVVYQALVKGDRFDTVLQKSTELGASEIVPVMTSRCTVKLTPAEFGKKVDRWQRIVYEAAKQCGRAVIPRVHNPIPFSEAVKAASQSDLPLFCYEGEGTVPMPEICSAVEEPETIAVLIGPEGGYSDEEAETAAQNGLKMTGLGRRILRTETAAPFVLSCLAYKYEL